MKKKKLPTWIYFRAIVIEKSEKSQNLVANSKFIAVENSKMIRFLKQSPNNNINKCKTIHNWLTTSDSSTKATQIQQRLTNTNQSTHTLAHQSVCSVDRFDERNELFCFIDILARQWSGCCWWCEWIQTRTIKKD